MSDDCLWAVDSSAPGLAAGVEESVAREQLAYSAVSAASHRGPQERAERLAGS